MKKIILITFFLLSLSPLVAQAQLSGTPAPATATSSGLPDYSNSGVDASIGEYLCTPTGDGQDLARCINKFYRFGIAAGALVLVAMVVFAGYLYITSGETGKSKAKGILNNSIIGTALLLGSYGLLEFINPSLIAFRPIQPPIFSSGPLPTCAQLGLGPGCIVATSTSGSSTGTGDGSIVSIAMAELGKRGAFINNRDHFFTIIRNARADNSGPDIDKYFAPGGQPGAAWCAYFATWVYGQAGLKTIGTLPDRGRSFAVGDYFRNNDNKKIPEGTIQYFSAAEVNSGSAKPLPGDLAIYDRGFENDSNGHIAIVTGYDPAQKKMSSIDGNVGNDEVKQRVRDINAPCNDPTNTCKLIGIGRVVR